MFHSSTTLRHHFRANPMNFGEKRLVHVGFKETLVSAWGGIARGAGALWRGFNALTLPAKLPLMPFWWGLKKGWQAFEAGGRYAVQGAASGVETVRSATVDLLGKPLWTLVKTPLTDIRMNLLDNSREIIKGVFRLPINLLRTPGAMVTSARESVSNLFEGGKNLLTFQGDFWNSVKGVSWRHPIKSTRNIIGSALGGVGEVLVPSAARAHVKACLETPWNVGSNIVNSKTQYLKAIPASFKEVRTGVQSTLGAPARGWSKGTNWVEARRKKQEEKDKVAKEAEQEAAEKEVKAAANAKNAAKGKSAPKKAA